jgi:fatty acid desaturase
MAAIVPASRGNLLLATALGALQLHQLFLLPLILLPLSPWWLVSLVPAVAATTLTWALLHEGFHRRLHDRRAVNDTASRGLAILFGTPFRILWVSHIAHHRLNGSAAEQADVYDPRRWPRSLAVLAFYARTLGGLYAAGCLCGIASFLPPAQVGRIARAAFHDGTSDGGSVARWAVQRIAGRTGLREMRGDAAAIVALYGLSCALYGEQWPWLAGAVGGRALLVSLLDNAFHYGQPLGNREQADNAALPNWLSVGLLHMNLHATHHRHPDLPWHALPDRFQAETEGRYDRAFLASLARQFRGPTAQSS